VAGGEGASDQELVEAVRAGETAAFSTLYTRHIGAVRREIARTTGDAPVGDLAQDVFVRALEALPALREPAAFGGWLLTIAHRAAINQRAFRGREQSLETTDSEALPDGGRQPDDLAALGELAELVRGAVAGLSARDAAAVRLVTDFGFSPEDLGPALGVTPGAARVVLHRARRRLRDALVTELLVRRQLDGCVELAPLHDQGDAIAAARHVRQCPACQDAARSEVVGYDLRVQAGHPDPRLA